MRRDAAIIGSILLALVFQAAGRPVEQRHAASGLVLSIDRVHRTIVVSCDAIPGYMETMVMPFSVHSAAELDNLAPGSMIDFTLVVDKNFSHVENVKLRPFESSAQEPAQARGLSSLQQVIAPDATTILRPGQSVPDFTLTDQQGSAVSLSEFKGKVVALNFIYTRCPLPDYCYRFSNYFGRIQKRFAKRTEQDLVLLTLTFDPVHDQPEVLANYAGTWKADPRAWHFLTGREADVRRVCGWFGVQAWPDEAALTHTLHTVVIDRAGKLVTNIEGNQYSAEQLGDLLEATMKGDAK